MYKYSVSSLARAANVPSNSMAWWYGRYGMVPTTLEQKDRLTGCHIDASELFRAKWCAGASLKDVIVNDRSSSPLSFAHTKILFCGREPASKSGVLPLAFLVISSHHTL